MFSFFRFYYLFFPMKEYIHSHYSKTNSLYSYYQRLLYVHDWCTDSRLHIYKGIKAEHPVPFCILFLTSELIISVMKHKTILCSALTLINMVCSCFGRFLIWSPLLREETVKIIASLSFWWYWLIVCLPPPFGQDGTTGKNNLPENAKCCQLWREMTHGVYLLFSVCISRVF